MQLTNIILSVFILLSSGQAFSSSSPPRGEVKRKCITSIRDILEDIGNLPRETTIAALDWDRTISSGEGNENLREPDGAKEVIQALHARNIKTMILTARGAGFSVNDPRTFEGQTVKEIFNETVDRMLAKLGKQAWRDNGALRLEDDQWEEIKLDRYLAMKDQIVFSGGTDKARALIHLIDEGKLKIKPTHIIFVDNNKHHILEFEKSFKDRPEIVHVYLYPHTSPEDEFAKDKACEKMPKTSLGQEILSAAPEIISILTLIASYGW